MHVPFSQGHLPRASVRARCEQCQVPAKVISPRPLCLGRHCFEHWHVRVPQYTLFCHDKYTTLCHLVAVIVCHVYSPLLYWASFIHCTFNSLA